MNIDLVARKVLCLSVLYYSLDVSLVPDHEFDQMCKRLSEEWDDLTPFRQWQLEPREDIRASGFHVKITPAALHSAIHWANKAQKLDLHVAQKSEWRESARGHWLPCDAFLRVDPTKRKRNSVRPKASRPAGISQGDTG